MLKRDHAPEQRDGHEPVSNAGLDTLKPEDILRMLRRQWPVIAACAGLSLLLAIVYLLTAAPRFTATMSIMIDTRKSQVFQNQQVASDAAIDSGGVESQVEVLRSDTIAQAVLHQLKLTDDPEFTGGGTGFFGSMLSLVRGGNPPPSDEKQEQIARAAFARNLTVKRVGLTYVIEVGYTSLSAEKAARIANAIGDAYLVGELDAKYKTTLRASKWLSERMNLLREEATAAETAVQTFKQQNNIVDTNRGSITDQQLVDANTQLASARSVTADAKARLERIQNIANGELPDATVAEALKNEVINRLRAQILDLTAREADWSARYGANHQAAANLRNQIRELKRSVADETSRIAQGLKSDYVQALDRERTLQANLDALVTRSTVNAQAGIKLRDLESTATSYRNLYDNFLQRFMEATQQQTFPASEARVISPASEPLRKSAPQTTVILAVALFAGLGLGGAVAFAREQMDNVFRESADMQRALGLEALGILPQVQAIAQEPGRPADIAKRRLRSDLGLHRHVVDAPFSRFTETLRNVKVAIDIARLHRSIQVVGVVSALPHEGKTTIAGNLAQLIANTKQRVLLIDADLRNPTLTRTLAPEARAGLVEVITGRSNAADVIWVDPATGMHFLPALIEGRISHTADLLSSSEMGNLLNRLREHYDYVVLDLPPVLPVVDVRAASYLIDGFVYVAAWGKTPKKIVAQALASVDLLADRAVGTVLNGANPSMLKRLEASEGRYYADYHNGYGYRSGA